MSDAAAPRSGFGAALSAYSHPAVRAMLFLGFASGLPFPLVLTTLSLRLREAGIDRTTIGFFSLVGLAYSLKYFWSPVVDRLPLPLLRRLGRRRSWMLFAQTGVVAGLIAMALQDPAVSAVQMAWLAVFTAFCAATQDIAVDAYRIESASSEWQGATIAAYTSGYQIALICGGAGTLVAASGYGWTIAYLIMAACMCIGVVTTLLVTEPKVLIDRATIAQESRVLGFLERSAHWPRALRTMVAWLIGAVVCPFMDFFTRNGWRVALPILALIVCYRLNYTTMGVAANTFYLDLGYTKDNIAFISKGYGILLTLGGAITAGLLVKRIGILKTMLVGMILLTAANLLYAYVAGQLAPFMAAHLADAKTAMKPDISWLAAIVSLDNVANGIAGTAFIAYMSSLTNAAYTATQYALFGTLWSLPAKSIASQWGLDRRPLWLPAILRLYRGDRPAGAGADHLVPAPAAATDATSQSVVSRRARSGFSERLTPIPYFHDHVNMEIKDAVLALAALAQGTRLAVYRTLVQAGPEGLAAGRIAEALSVPAATLSFHLKELGNAGLVSWRQSGRFVIYSANFDEMNALLSYLTANCCRGAADECLTLSELSSTQCCAPPKSPTSGKSGEDHAMTDDHKFNVLFLCTGNSARSILAEVLINHPVIGRGKFNGYSAGSQPKGEPNPYAIALLRERGFPVDTLRSKSWDEFAHADSPPLHFVFTVCDNAAGETWPYWPGQPMTAHWGLPDPAAISDDEPERKRRAFVDTLIALRRRIELFANLPLATLGGLALQQRISDIGRQ